MTGPARILLVGARTEIRRSLGSILRSRGFEVDSAGSGRQALALANERSPDLVLLHLALPDVDGLEVCADIRAQTGVLIIAVSTGNEEGKRVAALDAGADDCVSAHFGTEELLARIRAHLRRAPRFAPPRRPPRAPAAASVVQHDVPPLTTS
jgi:two-component system KDP operon response regulator KdpE